MKKLHVLAVLLLALASFIAGAYFYKWAVVLDRCYDHGGIIDASGFCVGWRV